MRMGWRYLGLRGFWLAGLGVAVCLGAFSGCSGGGEESGAGSAVEPGSADGGSALDGTSDAAGGGTASALGAPASAGMPVAYAGNYPVAYLANRIGAGLIEVRFVVPANREPAYWKPSEDEIGAMQGADLILLNGADYEKWVPQATLPDGAVVNTSAGVSDRYIETDDAIVHSHGPEGTHSHAGVAFTTWLDPAMARAHAAGIVSAIERRWPEMSERARANAAALEEELAAWDAAVTELTAALGDRPVFASHPVYQYLERRMNLNLVSLHWEPGEMPEAEAWADFDRLLESHPGILMLWEDEPLPEIRAALEERGVAVVPYLPCANRPESGDFLSAMMGNQERLRAAIAE